MKCTQAVKRTMKARDMTPFGLHLMFDAYDCDPQVLDDANLLYDFLGFIAASFKNAPHDQTLYCQNSW